MQTAMGSSAATLAESTPLHEGRLYPELIAGSYTCAFVNSPGCLHQQLFEPHYQRANRINSTKILRCFPHCCPRHVSRSYCGSSLTLHVQVPVGGRSYSPSSQIRVFSRFCVNDSYENTVGHTVQIDAVLSSIQSNDNTNGEWIPSQLVTRDDSVWIFEVNPSRRWYYAWCSGKTNAQRYTLHKLEAIAVVEVGDMYRVVARTESTSFTITSFRRCLGTNTKDERPRSLTRQLTALELALLNKVVGDEADSVPAVVRPMEIPKASFASPTALIETPLCDAIGIVCASIHTLPLGKFKNLLPVWSSYRPGQPSVVIREGTSAIATNLVFWLMTDPNVDAALAHHTSKAASRILDVSALRDWYERWMCRLENFMEQFLRKYSMPFAAILSLARTMLPEQNGPHNLSHPFDWENFIARVQIDAVSQCRHLACRTFNEQASEICGDWTCQPDAVQIMRTGTTRSLDHGPIRNLDSLPVTSALVFLQQLGSIRLRFNRTDVSLTISSLISPSQRCSRFVLDGEYRYCNALPHGESTMSAGAILGGQSFGDYIGRINSNDDGDFYAEITCFSWPTSRWRDQLGEPNAAAYRWQWLLRASEARSQLCVRLRVARGVVESTRGDAFYCRRVVERVGSVSHWIEIGLVNFTYDRHVKHVEWSEVEC